MGLKGNNTAQKSSTAKAVADVLRAKQVTVQGITYPTPFDTAVLTAVNGVFTLLRVLAILAVILSGMLILNTIITLIAEQTQIMGTVKALCWTRGSIFPGHLVPVLFYSI